MSERCLEATLAIGRDGAGVVTSARWSCDGEIGYPRLAYDPRVRRGTLSYSVEVDRFEAGTVHEEGGHPWGDPSEAARTVDAATWLDEALATIRARLLEHLAGKRPEGFAPAEAAEVVDYIEQHGLAPRFVSNTSASWQPFVALGKRLAIIDPEAALSRYQHAAIVVAGDEQKLSEVIAAVDQTLGRAAAARVRDGISHLRWAVSLKLDELLAIGGGRICAGALARLRARIAADAAVTVAWGHPADLDAARAHWRAFGKPAAELPASFADFLRSHRTVKIQRGSQTICELYDSQRWTVEELAIHSNTGKPRPHRVVIFGELQVVEDQHGSPRNAVYLLGERRDSEPQCGFLHRAAHTFNKANFIERRQLDFAAWLDALGEAIV